MPPTLKRRTPPVNATLTRISHEDTVDDGGGSPTSQGEVIDWEGTVPAFVADRRGDTKVLADQLQDTHSTEIVIPYRLVETSVPEFDIGHFLTTSRGKWRVTDWEDRRDFGFIRAFGDEAS